MSNSEYDELAEIYDVWSSADPASETTRTFYLEACTTVPGIVVELGIGTGRIGVEIARRGKSLIGVDISNEMLTICHKKAELHGVSNLITLIQDDLRSFNLPEPASLIFLPFRTIGHMLTFEDKVQLLRNVYRNLKPGGQFLFDHYVLDENWAHNRHGIPQFMCKVIDSDGNMSLVWDIYHFDFERQLMDCLILVEKLDRNFTVASRTYHPLSFSWIRPDQMLMLIHQAGLEVEALYGDFKYGKFNATSEQQIWLTRCSTG